VALPAYKLIQAHPSGVVAWFTPELHCGEDSHGGVTKFPTGLQAKLSLGPLCSHCVKYFSTTIPTLFLKPGVVDSGPEFADNALLVHGSPRAGDFKALLIHPREEQFQHSVGPPDTEEKLELVERMAAMRATLLSQVAQHYSRDLAG